MTSIVTSYAVAASCTSLTTMVMVWIPSSSYHAVMAPESGLYREPIFQVSDDVVTNMASTGSSTSYMLPMTSKSNWSPTLMRRPSKALTSRVGASLTLATLTHNCVSANWPSASAARMVITVEPNTSSLTASILIAWPFMLADRSELFPTSTIERDRPIGLTETPSVFVSVRY